MAASASCAKGCDCSGDTEAEPYAGYAGALYCMDEENAGGDIAFVKHSTPVDYPTIKKANQGDLTSAGDLSQYVGTINSSIPGCNEVFVLPLICSRTMWASATAAARSSTPLVDLLQWRTVNEFMRPATPANLPPTPWSPERNSWTAPLTLHSWLPWACPVHRVPPSTPVDRVSAHPLMLTRCAAHDSLDPHDHHFLTHLAGFGCLPSCAVTSSEVANLIDEGQTGLWSDDTERLYKLANPKTGFKDFFTAYDSFEKIRVSDVSW
eukprot:1154279-Pelagomonas_calceolata.AAC.13